MDDDPTNAETSAQSDNNSKKATDNRNKHEMNFIPNKHELYLINSRISRRERERERKLILN